MRQPGGEKERQRERKGRKVAAAGGRRQAEADCSSLFPRPSPPQPDTNSPAFVTEGTAEGRGPLLHPRLF
ncbi:hypothetical protein E2C01_069687 [Portunus trituberculatus]|uniref:Uncharacterized protein n=1 Tax=Portunus trituberculatus TaxID=210409 RepID=A0A5B7HQP7_PORTR|nr:hypothetical protein [Portunus trituberculatus]